MKEFPVWLERSLWILALAVLLILTYQFFQSHDLWPILNEWWQKGKAFFTVTRLSPLKVFSPTLLIGLISVVLLLFFAQPNTLLRALVGLGIIFLGYRYLAWRFFASLNLDNIPEGIFSVAIFVAEFVIMFDMLNASCVQTIPSTNLSPLADELSKNVLEGRYVPSVDIFVPTYNEPVEILKRTIIGCQAIDYPNKKVYLLDDTRRPEMRKLAEELGCYYLDRPDNKHAKAGNLNSALKQTNSELIVVFDADFVPTKNFLTRSVGFFQDPQISLLQTPQVFYSPDPIEANLGLENTITNEQSLFFRHIQPSRDAVNAIICCGTCYVARRATLEEIGGIPTESITEDFFTSVRMQIAGYRLRYLNEALSAGESPGNIGAYISQRLRWGQGTIQCLFCYHNPITVPGLNWVQRYYFLSSIMYWFMSLPRVLLLTGPIGYLIFGLQPLRATVEGVIYYFIPYYLANVLLSGWLTHGRRSPFWSNVYEMILCFPMAMTVIMSVIKPFGKGFKVTPKGLSNDQLEVNWAIIKPLVIIASLYAIGAFFRLSNIRWENNPEPVYVNLAWAAYNLLVFWVAILCAMDVPKNEEVSFPHELAYEIKAGNTNYRGLTASLSEKKVLIKLNNKNDSLGSELEKQEPCFISIPELGLKEVQVRLAEKNLLTRASDDPTLLLDFQDLTIAQERNLIEFLYCKPGQWDDKDSAGEGRFTWAYIKSILRMHPLTNT